MPKEISQERKEQAGFIMAISCLSILGGDVLPFFVYISIAIGLFLIHAGIYYLKKRDFSLLNGVTSMIFILIISAAFYKESVAI